MHCLLHFSYLRGTVTWCVARIYRTDGSWLKNFENDVHNKLLILSVIHSTKVNFHECRQIPSRVVNICSHAKLFTVFRIECVPASKNIPGTYLWSWITLFTRNIFYLKNSTFSARYATFSVHRGAFKNGLSLNYNRVSYTKKVWLRHPVICIGNPIENETSWFSKHLISNRIPYTNRQINPTSKKRKISTWNRHNFLTCEPFLIKLKNTSFANIDSESIAAAV